MINFQKIKELVEAVHNTEHEVWCDSLPRGTWIPTRCNCVLSSIVEAAEDVEEMLNKEGVKCERPNQQRSS